MSTSSPEDALVGRYVEAASALKDARYTLMLEETEWLLQNSLRWNSLRLGLLTRLQRALAPPKGERQEPSSNGDLLSDLKGMLTNVIIMQTRLNEREQGLASLLQAAAKEGLVEPIEVDVEDLRRWAESLVQAYQHLHQRASEPEA